MKITIKSALSSGSAKMDEYDVRQIKHALNRLGYYVPYAKVGMSEIPDKEMFYGVRRLQRDQGLAVTGRLRPDDETLQALNGAMVRQDPQGRYIWRTAGDGKVRPAHAALEGQVRTLAQSPYPAQEYNCRCWAEPVVETVLIPKTNCDTEKEKHEKAQKRVTALSKKLNDLLLRLQELIDENNNFIKNAKKILGAAVVAYILTLPFDRSGILSDLLRRYFGSIISNEFLQAADNFMRRRWEIKQKIQYTRDQVAITRATLEKAAKEFEKAKESLESCEKDKKRQ